MMDGSTAIDERSATAAPYGQGPGAQSSSSKPDPLSAAVSPYLSKAVAPFSGRSRRRRAATGAIFYTECSLQGIPAKEADDAAKETQAHFKKWWLQHRFKKGASSEDQSESFVNGRKRRRSLSDIIAAGGSVSKRASSGSSSDSTAVTVNSSEDGEGDDAPALMSSSPGGAQPVDVEATKRRLAASKSELLEALAENDGETSGPRFLSALEELKELYLMTGIDVRDGSSELGENCLDGVWLAMSKPNYHECLGKNDAGEYRYTLGRMSFDMFRPSGLECSIQGVFNPVFVTDTIPDAVPRTLRREIQSKSCKLRTYNIVTAFTIDPQGEEGVPLQGVMTTYGYILPDPAVPNRFSVWFTGGVLEGNEETDASEWARVFGGELPKRMLKERARVLAAKLLLGASVPEIMEEDGSMSYYLKRPIGGHGVVFCDVLYLDDTLRIMQGQHGSIYVMSRVPPCHNE